LLASSPRCPLAPWASSTRSIPSPARARRTSASRRARHRRCRFRSESVLFTAGSVVPYQEMRGVTAEREASASELRARGACPTSVWQGAATVTPTAATRRADCCLCYVRSNFGANLQSQLS
jgi:hypothetical protein